MPPPRLPPVPRACAGAGTGCQFAPPPLHIHGVYGASALAGRSGTNLASRLPSCLYRALCGASRVQRACLTGLHRN
jgi:hypothetical protein